MVAIPLTSGAYSSQSLIANAQRCRNLYPEKNPENTKPAMPVTHYPRPGLRQLSLPREPGPARCLYGATNGDLYAVIAQAVYYIDPDFKFNHIGDCVALQVGSTNPVYIADNGAQAILVDGSPLGYTITFPKGGNPRTFAQIADANFLGSTRADFIDSFLVLNVPGTNQWYSTMSDAITPFNALYIGVKTAWPDNILCVVTCERQVWVIGPKKAEIWFNAGAVPFPFQILSGNIIEQGCAAVYSPAKIGQNLYWLSQSPEGDRLVVKVDSQNIAQRVSTHAIEAEWRTYARIDDAIGSTYQISGHSFYKLHFPTADKTWGFDEATGQWHEDNWIDQNGVFHRARNTFCAFAYGKNVALDWATGALYQIDPNATDDNGVPIVWERSFPHLLNELKYVNYTAFTADVATGTGIGTGEGVQLVSPWSSGFSKGFGPFSQVNAPQLSMRMSRDGGYTFGNRRVKELISSGHYRTMARFRGNGIARDAVFELSSTAAMIGALNGAYVDPMPASS
jgi:hypothetical protein